MTNQDVRHTKVMADIELKKTELLAEIELRKLEAELKKFESQSSAKEVASKYIGKSAIPWIVLLVIVGVVSSYFLESSSLPAVIGLVSTASMALITMLSGITGTKDNKEDTPVVEEDIVEDECHCYDRKGKKLR